MSALNDALLELAAVTKRCRRLETENAALANLLGDLLTPVARGPHGASELRAQALALLDRIDNPTREDQP